MKIIEIVKYILDKKYYPATLFVFIRKIQDYSRMLIENTSLPELSKDEKEKVNNFFNKAISVIPKEEQNISQINYVKQILQYGVGVHHSGLLPILKEIIEILYFHGLIKILLATTSFSIGLNMPTRTVVFTSLEKYHEGKNQMINSSEFLQMCGRAGRRGIDEFGNIFILYTHPPSKNEEGKLKKILAGKHLCKNFTSKKIYLFLKLMQTLKMLQRIYLSTILPDNFLINFSPVIDFFSSIS